MRNDFFLYAMTKGPTHAGKTIPDVETHARPVAKSVHRSVQPLLPKRPRKTAASSCPTQPKTRRCRKCVCVRGGGGVVHAW